jgi:hypothetical protein
VLQKRLGELAAERPRRGFPTTITSHVTGQANQVYLLQHNALGVQTVETDPAGTSPRFFYDDRGLLTLRMNARGDSILTTYDALYRPLVVTLKRASGAVVRADSFFYDPAWRRGQPLPAVPPTASAMAR